MSTSWILRLTALAVGLALSGAPQARAALITYTTELQVGGMTVPSVSATTDPPPNNIGFATLSLVPVSGAGPFDPGPAGTVVPFATLTVDTSTLFTIVPAIADTIITPPVTLLLTITDQGSGESGTLTFFGGVGGSVLTAPVGDPIIPRITVGFSPVIPFPLTQTRSLVLGGTEYQVTMLFSGSLLISDQLVASSNFQVNIAAVPEPTTLTLLGLGAVALIGYRVRRSAREAVTA